MPRVTAMGASKLSRRRSASAFTHVNIEKADNGFIVRLDNDDYTKQKRMIAKTKKEADIIVKRALKL